eukprot:4247522-Pleurochrysis_carterae.AAC.1
MACCANPEFCDSYTVQQRVCIGGQSQKQMASPGIIISFLQKAEEMRCVAKIGRNEPLAGDG